MSCRRAHVHDSEKRGGYLVETERKERIDDGSSCICKKIVMSSAETNNRARLLTKSSDNFQRRQG
jgi:hypothetical protein